MRLGVFDNPKGLCVGHAHALGRGTQALRLLHSQQKAVGALAKKALPLVVLKADGQSELHALSPPIIT